MTRLTKTSLFALLGLTVTFAGSSDAFAGCRSGGGGYGGGHRYGSSYNLHHRPSYPQPVHRHPVHQPVQPIQQPVQPVAQQQFGQQPVGQPQFGQQAVGQQPVGQQPVGQQPVVQRQPVQQQAVTQQPVQQQAVAQQPVQQQTVTQQPVQTAPTTPQTSAAASAEQTALDLLSQFGAVETTQPEPTPEPQPQPQAFNGVGTWSATLGNGASISLEMRGDGSFTWTAVKGGKPSTFSGTFALDGESLTLIRNDRKQLNGTLIAPGTNGFTFKLDGVKDNGLQFARS
jgi:hypothetical protein